MKIKEQCKLSREGKVKGAGRRPNVPWPFTFPRGD